MKYFGVPTCPYCKKRVNLIRTWSLKRQGEYRCPRCSGISNIYLSPLIYVFALLAVFAGGAVYFFHKFILDDISFSILIQVVVPFAVFFFLGLFMVYLEKPVIKKVSKAELDKKRRREQSVEDRRMQTGAQPIQYDDGDYLPRGEYAAGPMPASRAESPRLDTPRVEPPTKLAAPKIPTKTPRPAPVRDELSQTSVVPRVGTTDQPQRTAAQVQEQPVRRISPVVPPMESRPQVEVYTPTDRPQATASRNTDDFFAKYDDPAYVERRLKELGKTDDAPTDSGFH